MRATEAPEQWRTLLEAVAGNDYDLAHKICMTYKFDKDARKTHKVRKQSYAAKSPKGEITHHESVMKLARYVGFSESHLRNAVKKSGKGIPLDKGSLAGWEFWER